METIQIKIGKKKRSIEYILNVKVLVALLFIMCPDDHIVMQVSHYITTTQ
jgi:hypothetical protein